MKCAECGERESDIVVDNSREGLEPTEICVECCRVYGEKVRAAFLNKCKRYHWSEKEERWLQGKTE